jgi:hypothetical protein
VQLTACLSRQGEGRSRQQQLFSLARSARFAVSEHASDGPQLRLCTIRIIEALKGIEFILDVLEQQVDALLLLCHGTPRRARSKQSQLFGETLIRN